MGLVSRVFFFFSSNYIIYAGVGHTSTNRYLIWIIIVVKFRLQVSGYQRHIFFEVVCYLMQESECFLPCTYARGDRKSQRNLIFDYFYKLGWSIDDIVRTSSIFQTNFTEFIEIAEDSVVITTPPLAYQCAWTETFDLFVHSE